MTPTELLLAVAEGTGPATKKAVQLIGEDRLAMLIAKSVLADTSLELSPTHVARVLELSETGARNKIFNTAVKLNGSR
jgi:hypothetical protein